MQSGQDITGYRVGVVGVILNSDKLQHEVRIEDDRENTGGYLVFERWRGSRGPNGDGWFDAWVDDELALSQLLIEEGWQIRWDQT